MTTEKFRFTRTPPDVTRLIFDTISVGEEQWALVETTSGARKERRESIEDGHDREKERSREAEKEREREHRRQNKSREKGRQIKAMHNV